MTNDTTNRNEVLNKKIDMKSKEIRRSYEFRKRKDLVEIRRRKLKELYERESENYEYEYIAKNKTMPNTKIKEENKNNYNGGYNSKTDITNKSNQNEYMMNINQNEDLNKKYKNNTRNENNIIPPVNKYIPDKTQNQNEINRNPIRNRNNKYSVENIYFSIHEII